MCERGRSPEAITFSKPPMAVVHDVVYDSALPNPTEHQDLASATVQDKDCITTHTNAAYSFSKPSTAAVHDVVYDSALPNPTINTNFKQVERF